MTKVKATTPAAAGTWQAALAAIGGNTLVGVMPLAARTLYSHGFTAPSMLFWRYSIAVIALVAIAKTMRLSFRHEWRAGAGRVVLLGATLGSAQTLCFWESLKSLDTSTAVLLFYTYPAVTLILDRLLFRVPIRPIAVLCIAVILLGAGLITLPGMQGGQIALSGLMWAVPAPAVYAAYLAISSRLLRRHPPLIGAIGLFTGMTITFAVLAVSGGVVVPESVGTWALMFFVALGPGALTMTLFSYAVPRLGASSFAILANAELVTVVAIGTLVLGEVMTPSGTIGGALIVAGILTHALWRKPPAVARNAVSPAPSVLQRRGL